MLDKEPETLGNQFQVAIRLFCGCLWGDDLIETLTTRRLEWLEARHKAAEAERDRLGARLEEARAAIASRRAELAALEAPEASPATAG